MYNFDQVIDRKNTGCIKWDRQNSFGVQNGLLPFWIADTDFAVFPPALEAMKERCAHPVFGYSDITESCLEAVCSWFKRRHNWPFSAKQLLSGAGVVTSLRFTLQAVTEPGDGILLFTPVYDPFFAIIGNTERKLVDCPLVPRDNSFFIDFDLVEKHFKEGTRAVVFCNPHNPVAKCWTYDELKQLAGLCAKYGVYVLSDEVHCDITLFGSRYTPMASFAAIHEKLVSYTAISKTFNMAGLVSSCMVIPNPALKARVAKSLGDAWIFGPSAIAFPAIEAAYTHGDAWVDELNRYIEGNAAYTAEFFAKNMNDVRVTKQEATFLMWLDFRCLGLGSDELTALLASKYRIALGNGAHYGKQADGFMRLNIGCPRSVLEQGLAGIHRLYMDRRN